MAIKWEKKGKLVDKTTSICNKQTKLLHCSNSFSSSSSLLVMSAPACVCVCECFYKFEFCFRRDWIQIQFFDYKNFSLFGIHVCVCVFLVHVTTNTFKGKNTAYRRKPKKKALFPL